MRMAGWLVAGLAFLGPGALAAQGRGCPEPLPDSLAHAVPPIYRACDVNRAASLRGGEPRLDFRPELLGGAGSQCFKATFRFVVDTLGQVELPTVHQVESTSLEFAQSVRSSLHALRYRPATHEGRPVRQVVDHERQMQVQVRVTAVRQSDGAVSTSPVQPRRLSGRGC